MKKKVWLVVFATIAMSMVTIQAETGSENIDSMNSTVPKVSTAVADVIKMAEAGTSEDVLLAYIQNSAASFDLSADQILYLRDIGVSSDTVSAMLTHDTALKSQDQAVAQPTQSATPAVVSQAEPAEAPAPTVAQPPPVYVSSAPEV